MQQNLQQTLSNAFFLLVVCRRDENERCVSSHIDRQHVAFLIAKPEFGHKFLKKMKEQFVFYSGILAYASHPSQRRWRSGCRTLHRDQEMGSRISSTVISQTCLPLLLRFVTFAASLLFRKQKDLISTTDSVQVLHVRK